MKKLLVALVVLGASVEVQAKKTYRAIAVLDSNNQLVMMKNRQPLHVGGSFFNTCKTVTARLQTSGEVLVQGMCLSKPSGYYEAREYWYAATLVQNARNNNISLPDLVTVKGTLMTVQEQMQDPMQQQDQYYECVRSCKRNEKCIHSCPR